MASHGDITEIRYSNTEVGSGAFYPKANEDNTYDLGGFTINDDSSSVAGNGEIIISKSRKLGFFQIVIENDEVTRKDVENIQKLIKSTVPTIYTVSLLNGKVYKCTGVIVGDVQPNVNTGLVTIKIVSGKIDSL